MSLNKVAMSGRLTRDIELKYSTTGVPIANGSLACNRSQKGEDGNYICDFFNIVAFRGTAEFLHQYVGKGNRVNIDGRLQTRSWTDQQSGQKRSVVEIVVDNVEAIDWKDREAEEGEDEEADSFADSPAPAPAPAAQQRPARRPEPQPAPVEEYEDDEVDPFASEDPLPATPVQAEQRQPARRQPVGAR